MTTTGRKHRVSAIMILVVTILLAFVVSEAAAQNAREIARDGRFVAYDDGTVLDTKTRLMWAAKDNGSEIDRAGAANYCSTYRQGGYSDWRLPTRDELSQLNDQRKEGKFSCETRSKNQVATDLIKLSCYWMWAASPGSSDLEDFYRFDGGRRYMNQIAGPQSHRVLPVRTAK